MSSTMNNNLYVDVHVLQTVPPSCVNRDDTNTPKTATYGGTLRARVSSQAWKHVIREAFHQMFEKEQVGVRTKYVTNLLAEELGKKLPDLSSEDLLKKANDFMKAAGFSVDQKKNRLDTLCFISRGQIRALAELASDDELLKDKKEFKRRMNEAMISNPSVDMAMFGRMIASDPSLNYDAAVQVAHAISTHEVHTEYDYFTAVDDCAPDDNAGAGHLGTVEFNSATLYRYASVNVRELMEHLGVETADAVEKFVQAFILTMPTGKQNTFANRTVPDMVYVTIRKDQPVNLCGAFEKAVPQGKNGYAEPSKEQLTRYAAKVYQDFLAEPELSYMVGGTQMMADEVHANKVALREMTEQLKNYITDLQDND